MSVRILGIDEAGRGCVLGPLCVGAFLFEGADEAVLRDAGADDSKRLAPERRVEVRARLMDLGEPATRLIPATAIDRGNLNTLEELAIIELVARFRPDRVILDALGNTTASARAVDRLRSAVGLDIEWQMEPKADQTWAVVGAASIFAKTTRDAQLDALRDGYGDLGSGYASDPSTRSWLRAWADSRRPWPSFVRTRWATVQELAQVSMF